MRENKTLIIWVPTWRCQLNCGYCDYKTTGDTEPYVLTAFERNHVIGKHLTGNQWVDAFQKYDPYHLEITGGEPTSYKDLAVVLDNLPRGCSWSITSNTLLTDNILDLFNFGSNCENWAASYHYHDDQRFLDNLAIIRGAGIPVHITMVLKPKNVDLCEIKIKWFNRMGYSVNVHPMLKQGHDWSEHMGIIDRIEKCSPKVNIVRDIPLSFKGEYFKSCIAGDNYFMAWPDGKVWRCYSQILSGSGCPCGHISDYLPQPVAPCNIECIFPCDRAIGRKSQMEVIK